MMLDDQRDADLARAAVTGDEAAFGQLMRRHKEPLYRVLRRMTGDADEAYDLLQESFLSAWRGLRRYDPARPFAGWIRTIALNKARDWGRRRAVRRMISAVLPGERTFDIADPAPSPETVAGDAQALRQLDLAIARLPLTLRSALVLTVFDGMSQAEAGIQLGITEKAVETRVRRARQILNAELDEAAA